MNFTTRQIWILILILQLNTCKINKLLNVFKFVELSSSSVECESTYLPWRIAVRINDKAGKAQDREHSGCPTGGSCCLGPETEADKDHLSCGSVVAAFKNPGSS